MSYIYLSELSEIKPIIIYAASKSFWIVIQFVFIYD